MATIFEKANWIAEQAGGVYEVFATPEDVNAYIADAPSDSDIWIKRTKACRELLEDFQPCIFDNENACVAAYIADGEFFFDGKTYKED